MAPTGVRGHAETCGTIGSVITDGNVATPSTGIRTAVSDRESVLLLGLTGIIDALRATLRSPVTTAAKLPAVLALASLGKAP